MRKTNICILLSLVIATLFSLTGCGTSTSHAVTNPVSVAIVCGAHANSRELNFSSQQVRDIVTDSVETEGFASVISADGDPDVIAELSFKLDPRYRNAAPERLEQDARAKVKSLLTVLPEVKADSPEVDTLKAIQLAARTLGDAPDGDKSMLIMDTGLSTTGILSFGNNLLTADPQLIADMLEERAAIPDLTDVRVVWQQLGDVADPQQELNSVQKRQLEAIWRTILERGGAEVEFSSAIPNNGKNEGLPSVSVLSFPKDSPLSFEPDTASLSFDEPVIINEEQVQFVGDSAEYLDQNQAERMIRPIAEYMERHKDFRLLLVGTTAGDANSEFSIRLSNDRAGTVKKTLVKMGVSSERILTRGMGSTDPWHIYGVGTDGPLASQNRKVVLMDANTQTARELLNS